MNNLKLKIHNFIILYFSENIIYANLVRRIGSFLVDTLIIAVLFNGMVVLSSYLGFDYNIYKQEIIVNKNDTDNKEPKINEKIDMSKAKQLSYLLISFSYLYYILFLISKKQATIGNQIFKIMVVHTKSGKITFFTAFIRYTLTLINNYLYWVGCILYFFRKDRAILQDIFSDTRVIIINKY